MPEKHGEFFDSIANDCLITSKFLMIFLTAMGIMFFAGLLIR